MIQHHIDPQVLSFQYVDRLIPRVIAAISGIRELPDKECTK
jgi:hypothetical protein